MRLTETAIQAGRKKLARRIERKFIIAHQQMDFARNLLRHTCRPDSEFPSEQINSLYFDSPDLDQHYRSLSGEFRKDKVRLRWYGREEELSGSVAVFIEQKSRTGFASTKQRRKIFVAAENLRTANLYRGIVSAAVIQETLAEFGYFPAARLVPVIRISYWRYRYAELMTGARAALDCHIKGVLVSRHLGWGEGELELPGGVIEVKGTEMELPPGLRRLRTMELDWSRFSKYSACIGGFAESPGSINRDARMINI